ncbi:hypothetical protein VTK73DRAFT_3516 [Phialemonium thermophilum]|uniref:Secreted protein n=1 Tax=Phialemonium thermophilum TaxID=223376 RepID=A0ABR3VHP0_9PEZI
MICVATSVLPVPGGPTTTVSPGCVPETMASICVGVKRTRFRLGASTGAGSASRLRFLDGLAGASCAGGGSTVSRTYGGPKLPEASSPGSMILPGSASTRCCQSRNVSRNTSCSHGASGRSESARLRIDSRTGLKLFSRPLLRTRRLIPSYTLRFEASPPPLSSW